jgi:hypothetical protein
MQNLKTRMRKFCVALITVTNFARFHLSYLENNKP